MAYLKSQGCSIHLLDTTTSPNAYSAVGQVVNLTGPDGSTSTIDVTHLASTGLEYIAGLPDFGNMSLTVVLDPATPATLHATIWDDFIAGTSKTWQMRLSDSPQSTLTFTAFPDGYSISANTGERVEGSISLKISGAPTASWAS